MWTNMTLLSADSMNLVQIMQKKNVSGK